MFIYHVDGLNAFSKSLDLIVSLNVSDLADTCLRTTPSARSTRQRDDRSPQTDQPLSQKQRGDSCLRSSWYSWYTMAMYTSDEEDERKPGEKGKNRTP